MMRSACSISARRAFSMRMAGDVGHHREQAQVVLGEFAQNERRIHVDQPDDAVLGLQRHRHHGVDLLLHDAHAALESVVQLRIAHQDRDLLLQHAIAHRRR